MNDITRTTADLAQYLNVIFGEEILLDKQKTLLQQLKLSKPMREHVNVPCEEKKDSSFFVGCCLFGEIAIPAAVVGIIIGAMLSTMISGYFMLWSVIGAEIIAALVAVFVSSWFVSSEEEKVDKNREEIRKAILKNEELEREYQTKLALWNEAINHVENRISEIKEVLALLYSDKVIYIKYQNLVAISAFKEYIDSGRVRTLLEAYDKFEVEYRLDTIQGTLNKIDHKLDLVLDKLDNMTFELAKAIRENSEESKKFNSEMMKYMDTVAKNQQKQKENLALIQNDQRCIAENTKVLGYIKNTQKRDIDMTPFVKMYNQKMYS